MASPSPAKSPNPGQSLHWSLHVLYKMPGISTELQKPQPMQGTVLLAAFHLGAAQKTASINSPEFSVWCF